MSKRQAPYNEENCPAKRIRTDTDAFGCLVLALQRELKAMQRRLDEQAEVNRFLHQRIERLEGYSDELELRLDAFRELISRMLRDSGHIVVEAHAHAMREDPANFMEDIDELIADYETEPELLDGVFDEEFIGLFEV